MQEPKKISEVLGEHLILTNLEGEQEKYILTPAEEDGIIYHATKRAMEHKAWRFKEMGLSEPEVLSRMAQIDFLKEINQEEILRVANSNKLQDEWHKDRRKKEREEEFQKEQELQSEWTAKRIFSLMRWTAKNEYEKDLIVNEQTKGLITAICFFLSADVRFETELGYSFNKGLLVRGVSGLGKTFLFQCVEKNELNPILILSMIDIADDVRTNGEYEIILGRNKMIYLDDVGSEEPTVNHYGTRINYFKNFIELCYLKNKTFGKLIISTNNSFAEIETKYGFRVRSRIKDMFNIVDVKGEDMRGKNV